MRVTFDAFELDVERHRLSRDGGERHLTPKAFALLAMLVEARPNLLTKASLQQRLWPEAFVVDANLSNLVAEVRSALGDDAGAPRFIRTVHRVGYAFVAEAAIVP